MELEELQTIFKELGCINEKQEKRVHYYETRAHHLTIMYIFFQGLILISVSVLSSSNQYCKRWWVPFTISLLPSIIFFMAFLEAAISYYNTQYHLDMNWLEQQIINKHIVMSKSAQGSIKIPESYQEDIKPDIVELFKRKVYISTVVVNLIVFTVVALFACHSFLCHDSSALPTASP